MLASLGQNDDLYWLFKAKRMGGGRVLEAVWLGYLHRNRRPGAVRGICIRLDGKGNVS